MYRRFALLMLAALFSAVLFSKNEESSLNSSPDNLSQVLAECENLLSDTIIKLTEEDFEEGTIGILRLLVKAGLASSNGDARRNVEQGGVAIDGEKVTDAKAVIEKDSIGEDGIVIKRGKKKFIKVVFR